MICHQLLRNPTSPKPGIESTGLEPNFWAGYQLSCYESLAIRTAKVEQVVRVAARIVGQPVDESVGIATLWPPRGWGNCTPGTTECRQVPEWAFSYCSDVNRST